MKHTVKGVRTDFMDSNLKSTTKDKFIAQWEESVWPHVTIEQRREELGILWELAKKAEAAKAAEEKAEAEKAKATAKPAEEKKAAAPAKTNP